MDKEVHIVSLFLMLQTPDIKSLDQLLLIQPDKKEMILSNMKEALLTLIDKWVIHAVCPGSFMCRYKYCLICTLLIIFFS